MPAIRTFWGEAFAIFDCEDLEYARKRGPASIFLTLDLRFKACSDLNIPGYLSAWNDLINADGLGD